jgi:Uma2 family endonuclease
MSVARKMNDRIYTYEDLLNFPENEVWELIDGIPYLQAEPSGTHQYISDELIRQINNRLEGKPCRAISRFPIWPEGKPKNKNSRGYLVPDILINCDPSIYTEMGLIGAPSAVIEILSPSNAVDDKKDKFEKYQSMGIQEYWIVSPEYRIVDVSVLDETGRYRTTCHKDTVKYNDIEIDLTKVFPPLPPETNEELC